MTLQGLSSADAAARLATHGPNELLRPPPLSPFRILAAQFRSPMIALLTVAALTAGALGEHVDAAAILAIVVLNGLVGFFQEYRAERAVLALRAMTAPRARVLRDARVVVVPAEQVTVGDLLLLEAGDRVAADARVLQAAALSTDEAPLTGESQPVDKTTRPSPQGAPLAERTDFVFAGTSVATGTGQAQVEAIGMSTQLGRIAGMLSEPTDNTTPLQARLAQVSRMLLWLCLGVVAVVFALGLWRGRGMLELLLSSTGLAVAVVPEGLPAVVTIALALGVQRMSARHVLVRRLPAVETLGCATVICTDKTGTLTAGKMSVREVWGERPEQVLFCAAACCDATLEGEDGGVGDPSELAILQAARERGIEREAIERERPRLQEHPFDAIRKRMSVYRADHTLYVKGALELLLPLCASVPAGVQEANQELASRGLRVLAVAQGSTDDEASLALLGLLGLADPPRPEAVQAVQTAREAGVRTVMITGDHPTTARAIALEMGVLLPGEDPALVVHARATPEDKLRIVREWKAKGDVVAMTGDGVNDAPALREADIGIAMGKTGTEVTREASDMILTDDNFASIVAAMREGRAIYENIRKTLVYLLSGNTAELGLMLVASLIGLPVPLLPLHLLWVNLITDGLPALALVMDPAQGDVLRAPPRARDEPILGRRQWTTIGAVGALEGALVLAVFAWALATRDLELARSYAFGTLVFSEVLRAFAARSERRLLHEVGVRSNLRLVAVAALTLAMQLVLFQLPLTQRLFKVAPLSGGDALVLLALGLLPVTVLELGKLTRRASPRRCQSA